MANQKLTIALDAESPDQRRRALLDLVHQPGAQTEDAFRALDLIARTDRDSAVRRASIAVLCGYTDARPVSTLRLLLTADEHADTVRPVDDSIRTEAVNALNKLTRTLAIEEEERRDVERLCRKLLQSAGDHHVRIAAATALGSFRTESSVSALIHALGDRDFGVVYEARASLMEITGAALGTEPGAWREWLQESEFRPAADARPADVFARQEQEG